jgi:hypothetical protein
MLHSMSVKMSLLSSSSESHRREAVVRDQAARELHLGEDAEVPYARAAQEDQPLP